MRSVCVTTASHACHIVDKNTFFKFNETIMVQTRARHANANVTDPSNYYEYVIQCRAECSWSKSVHAILLNNVHDGNTVELSLSDTMRNLS